LYFDAPPLGGESVFSRTLRDGGGLLESGDTERHKLFRRRFSGAHKHTRDK
jgi:hypothetical protein